jgi:hypothetical protein
MNGSKAWKTLVPLELHLASSTDWGVSRLQPSLFGHERFVCDEGGIRVGFARCGKLTLQAGFQKSFQQKWE